MTTWFTSDLHIGHRNCARLRGYENPDLHDARLADGWDAVIQPDDIVYVLGDLAMESGWRAALQWVAARPGRKRLIIGNHDPIHSGVDRQAHRMEAAYREVFETTDLFKRIKIHTKTGVQDVYLSHFPYHKSPFGDHYAGADDHNRFEQYRLPNLGGWLLHGHTHSSDKQHGKSIHVGVDAWNLAPVPLATIAEMIEAWEPSRRARLESFLAERGWDMYQTTPGERRWRTEDSDSVYRVATRFDMDDYPHDQRGFTDIIPAIAEGSKLTVNAVLDEMGEFRS